MSYPQSKTAKHCPTKAILISIPPGFVQTQIHTRDLPFDRKHLWSTVAENGPPRHMSSDQHLCESMSTCQHVYMGIWQNTYLEASVWIQGVSLASCNPKRYDVHNIKQSFKTTVLRKRTTSELKQTYEWFSGKNLCNWDVWKAARANTWIHCYGFVQITTPRPNTI